MFVSNNDIMAQLTKREEEIMQVIWDLENPFIKEIWEALPEPRPHYNTVATLVKFLEKKGFIGKEKLGNTYRYFVLINKEDYREEHIEELKTKYFDNSLPNMLAHFAKKEKLSEEEIARLIKIIKSNNS